MDHVAVPEAGTLLDTPGVAGFGCKLPIVAASSTVLAGIALPRKGTTGRALKSAIRNSPDFRSWRENVPGDDPNPS